MSKVNPWVSWADWQNVHQSLFSIGKDQVRKGIEKISAWRCRGQVPVAVEITGDLLSLIIQDARSDTRFESTNSGPLRLGYALAIVRLVNGIADQSQKGKYAQSVSDLASDVGLPRMLVDIRHESSHNDLPSLQLLRLAANQALSWLQVNYWEDRNNVINVRQVALQEALDTLIFLNSGNAEGLASESRIEDTEGFPDSNIVNRKRKIASGAKTMKKAAEKELLSLLSSSSLEASELILRHLSEDGIDDFDGVLYLCQKLPNLRDFVLFGLVEKLADCLEGYHQSDALRGGRKHRFQGKKIEDHLFMGIGSLDSCHGSFSNLHQAAIGLILNHSMPLTPQSTVSKKLKMSTPPCLARLSQNIVRETLFICLKKAASRSCLADIGLLLLPALEEDEAVKGLLSTLFKLAVSPLPYSFPAQASLPVENKVKTGIPDEEIAKAMMVTPGRWQQQEKCVAKHCSEAEGTLFREKTEAMNKALLFVSEKQEQIREWCDSLGKQPVAKTVNVMKTGNSDGPCVVPGGDGWQEVDDWWPCPIGTLPRRPFLSGKLPCFDVLGNHDSDTLLKGDCTGDGDLLSKKEATVPDVGVKDAGRFIGDVEEMGEVDEERGEVVSYVNCLLQGYKVVPLSVEDIHAIQTKIELL